MAKTDQFQCYLPATAEHVEQLKDRLRVPDLLEVDATMGVSGAAALKMSFDLSETSLAITLNGRAEAICGVVRMSVLSDTGCVWMLGSDAFEGLEVARRSRYYVRKMKANYARLENYIDARQKKSIRWLKWCGFTMAQEPIPFGIYNLPFFHFYMN